MARRFSLATLVILLATAAWFAIAADARAQTYGAPGWVSPEPNYYAMPTGPQALTAALYPSPLPTPPVVGQTYITYEALSPQEFLYRHYHYYKTYNGSGVTRTSVTYGHHLSIHPSLTHAEPGLHTPAAPCNF